MIQLNLPSYEIKLSGTQKHPTILDTLRRKYVALTPEEWVRQHFVHYLTECKDYPPALLANEVRLRIGEKTLRADTVVYDRLLRPLMIVEYKAPEVEITPKVFEQVSSYNLHFHVRYLAVSNGLSHYVCRMDEDGKRYVFLDDLPDYQKLLQESADTQAENGARTI